MIMGWDQNHQPKYGIPINLKLYIKSKTGKSPSVLNKTVELKDIKGKDNFY